MKSFSIEEAERMSEPEVMVEICKGLEEVCHLMAEDPKFSNLSLKALRDHAREFKAFARIWGLRGGCKHEERILKHDKKHGLFEECKRCGVFF